MNGNIYTSTITVTGTAGIPVTLTPYIPYSPFYMTTLPCMAALIVGFLIGNR